MNTIATLRVLRPVSACVETEGRQSHTAALFSDRFLAAGTLALHYLNHAVVTGP